MRPCANRAYCTYTGRLRPNASRAASMFSSVVALPVARRAGSDAGSLTKMTNVMSETTNRTNTVKSSRRIKNLPTFRA